MRILAFRHYRIHAAADREAMASGVAEADQWHHEASY
jgi:hypothetical protein